jgi:putative DNA primase/helicase
MAKKGEKYNPTKALLATLPKVEGEPDDYWEKNLEQNEKLKIVSCLRNIFIILTRDERWSGVLAFDEFAHQMVKRKAPPFDGASAGPWDDVDELRTVLWLAQHYRFNPDKKLVMQAATAAAHARRSTRCASTSRR